MSIQPLLSFLNESFFPRLLVWFNHRPVFALSSYAAAGLRQTVDEPLGLVIVIAWKDGM